MGLHMRYRLWIAEMNFYINILRILEDYLIELAAKSNDTAMQDGIAAFKSSFVTMRKEIDDLRHEMHILKMKLAAYSREGKTVTEESYQADNHDTIAARFTKFQDSFEAMKKDFAAFESRWR